VQADILGEVGILWPALLRAYSGTILPIFIEIGLYLTDKEQNISWQFLRHGVQRLITVTFAALSPLIYEMKNRPMKI